MSVILGTKKFISSILLLSFLIGSCADPIIPETPETPIIPGTPGTPESPAPVGACSATDIPPGEGPIIYDSKSFFFSLEESIILGSVYKLPDFDWRFYDTELGREYTHLTDPDRLVREVNLDTSVAGTYIDKFCAFSKSGRRSIREKKYIVVDPLAPKSLYSTAKKFKMLVITTRPKDTEYYLARIAESRTKDDTITLVEEANTLLNKLSNGKFSLAASYYHYPQSRAVTEDLALERGGDYPRAYLFTKVLEEYKSITDSIVWSDYDFILNLMASDKTSLFRGGYSQTASLVEHVQDLDYLPTAAPNQDSFGWVSISINKERLERTMEVSDGNTKSSPLRNYLDTAKYPEFKQLTRVLVHEVFHNIGIRGHAAGLRLIWRDGRSYPDESNEELGNFLLDPYSYDISKTIESEYGDAFSIMGSSIYGVVLAPLHQEALGLQGATINIRRTTKNIIIDRNNFAKVGLKVAKEIYGMTAHTLYISYYDASAYLAGLNFAPLRANINTLILRYSTRTVDNPIGFTLLLDTDGKLNNPVYGLGAGESFSFAGIRIENIRHSGSSMIFDVIYD